MYKVISNLVYKYSRILVIKIIKFIFGIKSDSILTAYFKHVINDIERR